MGWTIYVLSEKMYKRELFGFIGECSAIPIIAGVRCLGVHSVASAGHFPSQTVAEMGRVCLLSHPSSCTDIYR